MKSWNLAVIEVQALQFLLPKLRQRQEAEGGWGAWALPNTRLGAETSRVKTLVGRGWNTGSRSQEKTVVEREQKGLATGVSYPSDLYSMGFAACCSGFPSGRRPSQSCCSLGSVQVALWDKSAVPWPGVYCSFTFGRQLKPIWQKSVKLQS